MSSQISQLINANKRNFPPNLEEQSRKQKYPQTCSDQCPNHQCPYHNVDHYGQACEAQWQPKLNENMPLQSKPNPNEQLLRNIEISIAEALEKAMKPFEKRLQAMENAESRKPVHRSLNGTSPKYYRESLALGTIYD